MIIKLEYSMGISSVHSKVALSKVDGSLDNILLEILYSVIEGAID